MTHIPHPSLPQFSVASLTKYSLALPMQSRGLQLLTFGLLSEGGRE